MKKIKKNLLQIRLSDLESEMLETLAKRYHMGKSEFIRIILRNSFRLTDKLYHKRIDK